MNRRAPRTLVPAQCEHEFFALSEKAMIDPVLGVRLAIKRGALNVNTLEGRVIVDITYGSRLPSKWVSDIDRLEIRRRDQVNILARVREQAHHGKGYEGAHGAAIVIARQSVWCRAKEGRDIEVAAFGRESRSSSIVILKYGQESRFIANVSNP